MLIFALAATPACAHKLMVFAFADGTRIEGSVYFAGGGAATGARIVLKDAEETVLAELTPAADGGFSHQAHAAVDHLIVADAGDGHRAEWTLPASELAPGFSASENGAHSTAARADTDAVSAPAAPTGTLPAPGLDPTLEAAIEHAVARQVRPLREQLIASQEAFRLQDILGGIGYIFGLGGLALWWHSRRLGNPR
jgi:nickel transport protein